MDAALQADLRRLTRTRAEVAPLPGPSTPDPIPSRTQLGTPAGGASGSGGVIASPLTETSRTLHVTQAVSSDGLFVMSVPASITFADANGVAVDFFFSEPS